MSKTLNYSKWDNLEDSDEEDNSDVKQRSEQMERAWIEIARLQQIADGMFGKAEESKSMQEYQAAQKHYTEVLRLVKGALEAQRGPRLGIVSADRPQRANKHIIACNLNSACCYLRANNWTLAEAHCTEVISSPPLKMNPIEELRARHFRLYALSKQLADHVLLMEEYQFKEIPIQDGGAAAKLSERVEVDCVWVDKLIVLNPLLNDDQYAVQVREAQVLKDDARELIRRAKEALVVLPVQSAVGDDIEINEEEDRRIIAEWEREQELLATSEKGKGTGTGTGTGTEAGKEKEKEAALEELIELTKEMPKKGKEKEAGAGERERGVGVGDLPAEPAAEDIMVDELKWAKKVPKQKTEAPANANSASAARFPKPVSQPSPSPSPSPSVESLLQQAAKHYKKKLFEEARLCYAAVIEQTSSEHAPKSPEEGQARPMIRSLGLAGEGSCLVGLKRHDEALPGLQSALVIFMDYVKRWVQTQTNALDNVHSVEVDQKLEKELEKTKTPSPVDDAGNMYTGRFVLQGVVWWIYEQPTVDDEGCVEHKKYFVNTEAENLLQNTQWADPRTQLKEQLQKPLDGEMIPEEQILNVARHVWNTMDNIMECLASKKTWALAIKHCNQSLAVSESLLGWEKSMGKAKRASSVEKKKFVLPSAMQPTIHEASYRHTMSLLTKGHVLLEMSNMQDTPEGKKETQEYLRMQNLDDLVGADKKDELFEDCVYYWQEAAEGFRKMKNFLKSSETYELLGKNLSAAGSSTDQRGTLEPYMDWDESPRVLNDDCISRAHLFFANAGKDAGHVLDIERDRRGKFQEDGNHREEKAPKAAEKWEIARELNALHRVINNFFSAGIHALYCKEKDGATQAIRSLEQALMIYRSFIKTTRIAQAIEEGSEEYRNFHCIVGDLSYHAALAYFRVGEIPFSYDLVADAIEAFKISEDRTRMQHALGLRSLILTLMDQKETAEASIVEAGKLAKEPLESSVDVVRQIRLYLSRHAPKSLLHAAAPTPKMMPLAPEDAARAAARKAEEESTLKKGLTFNSNMRVEHNPEMYEKVEEKKPIWARVLAFMTGDGIVSVVFGWSVIVMALVAVYMGFKKLQLVADEVNSMPSEL